MTSTIEMTTPMGKVNAPYASVVHYYGFVQPGKAPDMEEDGKKCYCLYLWVPAIIDELGVRMISPPEGGWKPGAGDFKQEGVEDALAKNPKDWFDTWVRVKRMSVCGPTANPEDINDQMTALSVLGDDDDGDDTYKETRHSKYNSILRIKTSADDPLKALIRGVYQIVFTTYKVGEVKGGFLASVGTNIPGCVIATSPEALKKACMGGGAAPAGGGGGGGGGASAGVNFKCGCGKTAEGDAASPPS